MTSRDVIHSFYVPAFRIKKDVLPGRYTQVWFEATKPGTYQVLCTEYCGLSHSTMLAEVVVMPPPCRSPCRFPSALPILGVPGTGTGRAPRLPWST